MRRELGRCCGALLVLALAGCAASRIPDCAPPAAARPAIELFFGRGIPGGGEVTEAEWRGFVDTVLTPRFPDGLTELDALGQFAAGDAILHERSKLVLIVPVAVSDLEPRVDAAIDAYKQRFHQQSVLRIDRVACVRLR